MALEPDEPVRSRRPRVLWLVVLVGVALVAAAALFLYPGEQTPAPPAGGAGHPSAPSPTVSGAVDVQVITPTRRDVAYTITLPANVAPLYQTTLYAKVSGYLKWIGPDKGDHVKKGQVLAVIDAPEVEEQYHQAVADYKIRKLTFERMANVWKETPDVIAKQDVDVAEAAFQGAKHAMEQREALRNYTKVAAPYDGVITARFADPGALIQVATNSATSAIPLFTIMALETVRVYASVPQEDTPWVKVGIPGALKIKEFNGAPITGTVTRTTESLDPATRSLLVEVDLPNPDHRLQPGTFGELTLTLKVSPQALVIPPGAITIVAGAKSIFTVHDGRAHVQPVKTGLSDGRWTEILDGLAGDEQIVVAGKSKLNEGTPVTVTPYQLPEGTPSIQKFPAQRPNP